MIALLALAAAASVLALLVPAAARWAWMAAALLTAGWTMATAGLSSGLPLAVAVVASTLVEPTTRPVNTGFEDLVARLLAVLVGVVGAVLVVIRVLQSDVGSYLAVFLLVLMGLAVAAYVIAQPAVAERARAARLGMVLAASGWAAGGHPGVIAAATAGVLVLVTAVAAHRSSAT